jgi:hypothetical protein
MIFQFILNPLILESQLISPAWQRTWQGHDKPPSQTLQIPCPSWFPSRWDKHCDEQRVEGERYGLGNSRRKEHTLHRFLDLMDLLPHLHWGDTTRRWRPNAQVHDRLLVIVNHSEVVKEQLKSMCTVYYCSLKMSSGVPLLPAWTNFQQSRTDSSHVQPTNSCPKSTDRLPSKHLSWYLKNALAY